MPIYKSAYSIPIAPRTYPELDQLLSEASHEFGVSVEELVGPQRWRPLILYRHATIAAVRELTNFSAPAIAFYFGGRDHTSVLNSLSRAQHDPTIRELKERLTTRVMFGQPFLEFS